MRQTVKIRITAGTTSVGTVQEVTLAVARARILGKTAILVDEADRSLLGIREGGRVEAAALKVKQVAARIVSPLRNVREIVRQ